MFNIVIIEPSPTFSLGLETLLSHHGHNFHIAGTFRDIPSFKSHRHHNVDAILINTYAIGFTSGFNIRELFHEYEESLLVAVTPECVMQSALDTFDGVLNVYEDCTHILARLHEICKSSISDKHVAHLTHREKEIIIEIALGRHNREIADDLHLSLHTIVTYRKRIAEKTGIKGVAGLIFYASTHHLLDHTGS